MWSLLSTPSSDRYKDPGFVQQEDTLRRRAVGQRAQMYQRMLASGMSPEVANAKLMTSDIGTENRFANLYQNEEQIIAERKRRRREERNAMLNNLLGMVVGVGTDIAGYKMLGKMIPGQTPASTPEVPAGAAESTWGALRRYVPHSRYWQDPTSYDEPQSVQAWNSEDNY